ncbi:MAG: ATP-binding protein [Chlamydiae bacterium]|nr:ATP-binding protein [Chlamydiota bacterium]
MIRNLAEDLGLNLIELNFEKRPELKSLFDSNNPQEILMQITAYTGKRGELSRSLLFLDEIQVAPSLLASLRWFAEELPSLAVVAAGSLLDFTLAQSEYSMPVGRIGYMYVEPLSFEEFLMAMGEDALKEYLDGVSLNSCIPQPIHTKLMDYVKEYMIVGGMPSSVVSWKNNKDLSRISQIHYDLLTTYRDDFAKYRGRLPIERLQEVIQAIPRMLGQKFVFSHVNPSVQASSVKQALDLLSQARLCHYVSLSAASGLPLGAEVNEKFFKTVFLDCGLCCASLGLTLPFLSSARELTLVNNGGMAEQVVGQLLRTIFPPFVPPELYYWQRAKKGAQAEIDYVMQYENYIIPIEVKAGVGGSLKSLHQFMKEKKYTIAVRVNSDVPSLAFIEVKDELQESSISYQLMSIPFYLIEQLPRLLALAFKRSYEK